MTIVMIIVLLGGRFRLFGENERSLVLEGTKHGGLQNVRSPIIALPLSLVLYFFNSRCCWLENVVQCALAPFSTNQSHRVPFL